MNNEKLTSSENLKSLSLNLVFFCFSFIILFFCSKSSPLYFLNDWTDANVYFTVSKGLFNGYMPYKDLFDQKGPLFYFIYSTACFISTVDFTGVYILESLALWINLVFAFKISNLYLSRLSSICIAFLYVPIILNFTNEGGSTEEIMGPFITISLYLFLCYYKNLEKVSFLRMMFFQGMLCSIILLIKINCIVFWVFPLLSIGIYRFSVKEYKDLINSIKYFLLGFIVFPIPVLLYFIYHNALGDLYDAYIVFNSIYAKLGFRPRTFFNAIVNTVTESPFNFIVFTLTIIGQILILSHKSISDKLLFRSTLPLTLLALSYLIMQNKFFIYSLLPLVPLLLLSVCIVFAICYEKISLQKKQNKYLAHTFVLITIVTTLFLKKDILDSIQDNNLCQLKFSEIILAENKHPDVLTFGHDQGFYLCLNIIPKYKFFHIPFIRLHEFPLIEESLKKYVNNKEPEYIIVMDMYYSIAKDISNIEQNYYTISTFKKSETQIYSKNEQMYYLLKRRPD